MSRTQPATPPHAPSYLGAALAMVAVGALYAATLAPTTQFWDTSEYIATSYILGIPHPPGNPLFVLLGRTWIVLLEPFGLSVAVRVNLFSAFMSAAAHGLWFLVVQRILSFFSADRSFQLAGAATAVLLSATAFTVWNQSNVNEKVYTVSLLTIALLSVLIFRWRDRVGQGKDDNLLVLIAFILALSVGNHLMAFLAAPAILALVLMVHPGALRDPRLYLVLVVVLAVGLSVHLFLPIRSGLAPVINEAEPVCTSVGSALLSILSWGQAGCAELSAALGRQQYDKPPLFPRQAPLHMQLANYLQYFDWQWSRAVDGAQAVFAGGRAPFTALFGALGLLGAIEHRRHDRISFAYVAVLFTTLSAGLVLYLNFKYGYSLAAPVADRELHEVRERDYFFVAGFSVWGLWSGIGLAALWRWLGHRVGGATRSAPVLGLALLPLVLNASRADRSYDHAARDWAFNLLSSVEPYAVLFTNGDNDTFPLWYLQEVEGIRQDVTVIVTSYLNTSWYAGQLRELTRPCAPGESAESAPTRIVCQRAYRPGPGGPVYHAGELPEPDPGQVTLRARSGLTPPTTSILPLDDATIDEIAGAVVPLDRDQPYRVGRIAAALPRGQILFPWHQYALAIISTVIRERPVYFASSGNAPTSLGLDSNLIREGLAYRLFDGDLAREEVEGVVRLDASPLNEVTGTHVDAVRTETLLEQVFVHRSGIPDWPHWPDAATIGIPNYYSWAYYAVSRAAAQVGDTSRAARLGQTGDAWTLLGR